MLVETPHGEVNYLGDARIDGAPGTSAPIARSISLMPLARFAVRCCPQAGPVDIIHGVACTLIDNGMPVIVMRASDFGRTGHEPRDQLDRDAELKAAIERIAWRLVR